MKTKEKTCITCKHLWSSQKLDGAICLRSKFGLWLGKIQLEDCPGWEPKLNSLWSLEKE